MTPGEIPGDFYGEKWGISSVGNFGDFPHHKGGSIDAF
jgi:hypothetical protein